MSLLLTLRPRRPSLTRLQMLAQLLRQNGGCKVTIAAPGGLKMDLAKSLEAADEYLELSRSDPAKQFAKLRAENPYGFDIGEF